MDIKRLKELKRLLGKVNPLDGSDWSEALTSAEDSLDETIARQSVKSEEVAEAIKQKLITDAMDCLNKNTKQPFVGEENKPNDI